MANKANSISFRGENGIVRIVGGSAFLPDGDSADGQAEYDVAVESNGFRAARTIMLGTRPFGSFLSGFMAILRARSGTAAFRSPEGDLSLRLAIEKGELVVECELNDENEGRGNSIRVVYSIEPEYFEDLELAFDLAGAYSVKG